MLWLKWTVVVVKHKVCLFVHARQFSYYGDWATREGCLPRFQVTKEDSCYPREPCSYEALKVDLYSWVRRCFCWNYYQIEKWEALDQKEDPNSDLENMLAKQVIGVWVSPLGMLTWSPMSTLLGLTKLLAEGRKIAAESQSNPQNVYQDCV